MAYRPYTSAELHDIATAMEATAKVLTQVAKEMDSEGLTPAEFSIPTTLTPRALGKVGSDSRVQMNDLLREKRLGIEAEFRKIRAKNEKNAKKLAAKTGKKVIKDLEARGLVRKKKK